MEAMPTGEIVEAVTLGTVSLSPHRTSSLHTLSGTAKALEGNTLGTLGTASVVSAPLSGTMWARVQVLGLSGGSDARVLSLVSVSDIHDPFVSRAFLVPLSEWTAAHVLSSSL